jgi:hypothetical protein
MAKALLAGNGMTAKIISDYEDCNMMTTFDSQNHDLLVEINNSFEQFRYRGISYSDIHKDTGHGVVICNNIKINKALYDFLLMQLTKIFSNAVEIFTKFFIKYSLIYQVMLSELYGIESLLKVANMLKMDNYNDIRSIANILYYNNGNNGLSSARNINVNKFKAFIDSFDFIFTTNYDKLLDDSTKKKIYHLHGGFNYTRLSLKTHPYSVQIFRVSDGDLPLSEAYLIWGIDEDEKIMQMEGRSFLPFFLGITPYPRSALSEHLAELKKNNFNEIHIWGYSGQNDGHISKAIVDNHYLKNIFIYCNPSTELGNKNYEERIKQIYSGSQECIFKSWNEIWAEVE